MERTCRPMQISYAHTSFHRCLNRGLVSQIFVKELGQSLIKFDSFTELWRQRLVQASTYSNYVIFSIRHIEVSTLIFVLKSSPELAYVHKGSKDKMRLCRQLRHFDSFTPRQNCRNSADDVFRCIFANEKFCILIEISLNFVPKGPIDNNQASVYIMAWCRIGDKPLSEPMLTQFTDAYMRH